MNRVNLIVALAALMLGGMNAYQAVTGRRLSRRPSTRSDQQMRRQSAIAAVVLIGMATVVLIGLAIGSLDLASAR